MTGVASASHIVTVPDAGATVPRAVRASHCHSCTLDVMPRFKVSWANFAGPMR